MFARDALLSYEHFAIARHVIFVDANHTRTLASGELSSLTNGAISVLRLLMGKDEVMMKAKAEDIHDTPKAFLKKLGCK